MKKKEKLAWLAGIVDGEGTLGFYKCPTKGRESVAYQKTLCIVNADEAILTEVSNILNTVLGVDVPINKDVRHKSVRHPHIYFQISVRRYADLKVVLAALIPYLVSKKAQALLLLELLNNRKNGAPYTPKELTVIEELKVLKQNQKQGFNLGNPELAGPEGPGKCRGYTGAISWPVVFKTADLPKRMPKINIGREMKSDPRPVRKSGNH